MFILLSFVINVPMLLLVISEYKLTFFDAIRFQNIVDFIIQIRLSLYTVYENKCVICCFARGSLYVFLLHKLYTLFKFQVHKSVCF